MSDLLSVEQVREHVETDLVDDALERVLDAADAEIIRRLGPLLTQTEVLEGGAVHLPLSRAAASITSASERFATNGMGYQTVALVVADDLRLLDDGRRVERLFDGSNPADAWRGEVTIVYAPADAGAAERAMLLVNLIKLDLGYTGHLVQSVGDVRVQSLQEYNDARAALFRPFASSGRRLIS